MSGLVLLIIGVLLGGAVNVAVTEISRYLSRQAVGKGLLVEIRYCADAADRLRRAFEKVLEDPDRLFRKAYFQQIEVPLWSAASESPSALPREHLPQLVAFFARVSRINHRVRSFLQEQERLPAVYREHAGEERASISKSILQALQFAAKANSAMCAELAKCRDIRCLGELACEYNGASQMPTSEPEE